MNDEKKRVLIDDTTLRDGEQSPGVFFSAEQKLETARRLDRFGVDQIEAGTPAMGGDEQEAIRAIAGAGLKADVFAWCRAVEGDIDAACACGVRNLHISLPVSDIQIRTKLGKSPDWILTRLKDIIRYTASRADYISIGAEDASRADYGFLDSFIRTAIQAGAGRFRYCDTVGILDPFTTRDIISRLSASFGIPLEFHAHNDFGMATANTLAAIDAGTDAVNVTVNGLGERAGNASLEEVVMSLKYLRGCDIPVKLEELLPLCRFVSRISGRDIGVANPITGSMVFAHESGIHADGVLKDPANYEPFPPEDIGQTRSIPVGKHSGSHALRYRMDSLGVPLSDDDVKTLLPEIQRFIGANNRIPSDHDIELVLAQKRPVRS